MNIKDLRYLNWTISRNSSGTAGNFLKSYSKDDEGKWYWKLSNYSGEGVVSGHECLNEMIACRLMEVLNIPHLHYELLHGLIKIDTYEIETYLVRSKDYKKDNESKMALDQFYTANRNEGETPWQFIKRMGWQEQFYNMFLLDYLILNRDRHGANIEVLYNKKTDSYRLSPIFDNGLSLMFSVPLNSEAKIVNNWDVLADRPVNNFVGSLRSTKENLKLLPPHFKKADFNEKTKAYLFQDVKDAMPDVFINRLWTMITERWLNYEIQSNR